MDLITINVSSLTFADVDKDVRSIAMLYTAYKIGESHKHRELGKIKLDRGKKYIVFHFVMFNLAG